MEYAENQPTAADYAGADARQAHHRINNLDARVERIENLLGLPHTIPKPDPVELAKIRDAEANGRQYP